MGRALIESFFIFTINGPLGFNCLNADMKSNALNPDFALPLQQHPFYADTLALLGRESITLSGDGHHAQLMTRRFGRLGTFIMASRGPIWRNWDDQGAILHRLAYLGTRIINDENTSTCALRRAGFRRIVAPAHVAELPLTGSGDDRISAANGKWRNAWRKAQNAPFKTTHRRFNPVKDAWLLTADTAQQRTKKFRALPHSIIHAYAHAHPSKVRIAIAHRKNTPLAAMLFLQHGRVATYHLGWSGPEGRKFAAHNLLLMQAADDLAQRGVQRLDLGMVNAKDAPGLTRFKRGCGANVRQLGGTWLRMPFL